MNCEIITIGDEILIGQIVDTNSAWLGQNLNAIGVKVVQITSVQDSADAIKTALAAAATRANIVLITGGLGPTKDDITKKVLCQYFGVGMVRNAQVVEHLEAIFTARGRKLLDVNLPQADLPANCQVLWNRLGTAPGMWFEQSGVVYVSMPGVPYEMKTIAAEELLPRIKATFSLPHIVHKTILTAGIPESALADLIKNWEENLPPHIKLAYLPSPGRVRLRLSYYNGTDPDAMQKDIENEAKTLLPIIKKYHFGYETDTIEQAIGKLLMAKSATLSTAESCTGGYIAQLITGVAGSSRYFEGGVVAYSYELKEKLLGVRHDTLYEHGAVSQEAVTEMAEGARQKLGTMYSIAVSGIAGPSGGTPDKPVGTVWIAVGTPTGTVAKQLNFGKERSLNIERSAQYALFMLWQLLSGVVD
jgi:nicotinamide-nucleotide amidase